MNSPTCQNLSVTQMDTWGAFEIICGLAKSGKKKKIEPSNACAFPAELREGDEWPPSIVLKCCLVVRRAMRCFTEKTHPGVSSMLLALSSVLMDYIYIYKVGCL